MMQLMQSYEMEDGVIGVDDMKRWPLDSDAFSFLEATSSARSVETLKKVGSYRLIETSTYNNIQPASICRQKTPPRRAS